VSGDPVVDVAIGLSFLFFVLSVLAMSIVEAVAGLLSYRARSLENWLAENLTTHQESPLNRTARIGHRARNVADSSVIALKSALKGQAPSPSQQQMVARRILAHPAISTMMTGRASRPSYVPRERFVSALLERGGQTRAKLFDALASGQDATARTHAVIQALPPGEVKKGLVATWISAENNVEKFRPLAEEWFAAAPGVATKAKALIEDLPDGSIKHAMRGLWIEAGNGKAFRKNAETWFDQVMQRLSGSYKRRTQVWLWTVGLALALVFDLDTIKIAVALWQDQTLRQVLAAQAQNAASPSDALGALGLPFGWEGSPGGVTNWVSATVGLVLTSAAVSLGAAFWFDTLSKLANVRNTGPKPIAPEATFEEYGTEVLPVMVEESVRTAVLGPPLTNWRGFVGASVDAPTEDGIPSFTPRQSVELEVRFSPEERGLGTERRIDIRDGADAAAAIFNVRLESDTLAVPGEEYVMDVPADGEKRIVVPLIVPTAPGPHRVWVRVSQRNRVVQMVPFDLTVSGGT
jgi:hypothetical protein